MKTRFIPFLVVSILSFLPGNILGAQTAQARMYCYSLHFIKGQGQTGEYSLELTTLNAGVNGELAPWWGGSYSHYSYLYVNDEYWGGYLPGTLEVDVPETFDANKDGQPDLFDLAMGISGTTSGRFNISGVGQGTVQASWSRSAGSEFGTCVLVLKQGTTTFDVFTQTFYFHEYQGPITYTPGATNVTGFAQLTQTDDPNNQMGGPVQFVKAATNRFNVLTLKPGTWTNQFEQTLTFVADVYERYPTNWPTNYIGYFDFVDGDPNTSEPDFLTWVLVITDLNDTNRNGIPDFSDDPGGALPRAPRLSLTSTSTNVLLSISGDAGRVHFVQETTSLGTASWQTVQTVTLTNDPQVVSLALPAGSSRFWRVQAQ